MRLALSRKRELLADAGSVELTKNPDAMISALRKIEGRGELPGATSAVMELCLDNPREGFHDLFATHPSVDARVQALVKYAGGHDPGPLALPADTAGRAGWSAAGPGGRPAAAALAVGPLGRRQGSRRQPRKAPRRAARPLGQSARRTLGSALGCTGAVRPELTTPEGLSPTAV